MRSCSEKGSRECLGQIREGNVITVWSAVGQECRKLLQIGKRKEIESSQSIHENHSLTDLNVSPLGLNLDF